ncbi:hypothetical protein [Butyrivibrio sp. INlla14]|uniref:hypothetical protein n=1 Tax=Butyrivibrio sp. INlla14 TaxID=1520808 RepID=UPI000876D50C|nr:hypothetical protein [Butyrivibrio sp. INlla14]SCX96575.1 hypothetical protein SAMN02910371_00558 [Butyrivibrio sp. INlla14]
MRKTTERTADKLIAVDINGLAAMLSCGEASARKIGEDACARFNIGRRVLYSVSKVEKYVEAMAI